MSKFCGKCDCYDHFFMRSGTIEDVEAEIKRTNFYIFTENGRRHKLDIHSIKDLAPYYPYLIAMGSWWNKEHGTIVFSSESFVDREEREFMEWDLRDALAEYKKCKRKKIPFDPDAYYDKISSYWSHSYTREIIDRVARDGLKANLDGLHSDFKDKYERSELARELKKLGHDTHFINEWVFGYRKEYPNWEKENEDEG